MKVSMFMLLEGWQRRLTTHCFPHGHKIKEGLNHSFFGKPKIVLTHSKIGIEKMYGLDDLLGFSLSTFGGETSNV